jgi:hypothetical protein
MIPDVDTHRIPALLADDITATIGETYLSLLRGIVKRAYELVAEPVAHSDDLNRTGPQSERFRDDEEAQAIFDWKVIEDFQQGIHDEHIDTTWPTCPRHTRHPLTFDHEHKMWRCPMDSTLAFPLGALANS